MSSRFIDLFDLIGSHVEPLFSANNRALLGHEKPSGKVIGEEYRRLADAVEPGGEIANGGLIVNHHGDLLELSVSVGTVGLSEPEFPAQSKPSAPITPDQAQTLLNVASARDTANERAAELDGLLTKVWNVLGPHRLTGETHEDCAARLLVDLKKGDKRLTESVQRETAQKATIRRLTKERDDAFARVETLEKGIREFIDAVDRKVAEKAESGPNETDALKARVKELEDSIREVYRAYEKYVERFHPSDGQTFLHLVRSLKAKVPTQ